MLSTYIENLNDAFGVGRNARKIGAIENGGLQGAGFMHFHFCLFTQANVAQNTGEVTLTPQHHFADCNFHRENTAILASAIYFAH